MARVEVTAVNFRQHAHNLYHGSADMGIDLETPLSFFFSRDQKFGHYKPELYSIIAVIGEQMFNHISWPEKIKIEEGNPVSDVPFEKRLGLYAFFKKRTLDFLLDHLKNFTSTEPWIADKNIIRAEQILLEANSDDRDLNSFMSGGFGTAVSTFAQIAEIIPRVYQKQFGRKIDSETGLAMFRDSRKIFNQMANQHINTFIDMEQQIEVRFKHSAIEKEDIGFYNYFQEKYFVVEENLLIFRNPSKNVLHSRRHGEKLGCPGLIKLNGDGTLITRLHQHMTDYTEQVYNLDPLVEKSAHLP